MINRLKGRVTTLESHTKSGPPPVIFVEWEDEEERDRKVEEAVKLYDEEYPNSPRPIVYIIQKINKPPNAGLSDSGF